MPRKPRQTGRMTDAQQRDAGKRTPAAKQQTISRKRARAAKRAHIR